MAGGDENALSAANSSGRRSGSPSPQSKRLPQIRSTPFFKLLGYSGGSFHLCPTSQTPILDFSPSALADAFGTFLVQNQERDIDVTLDDVLADFEAALDEDEIFLAAASSSSSLSVKKKTTLIRTLLLVSNIQKRIIETLLQKLVAIGIEAPAHATAAALPKLLIRQLKWMEVTVDGEALGTELASTLASMASVGTPFSQTVMRELLGALPEILDAGNHAAVVNECVDLMEKDRDLIVPAIDTLCNLRVDESQRRELVRVVISVLKSATVEDLPVVVRYLLQCVPTASAENESHDAVMWEIRKRMASIVDDTDCESGGALVLDAIKCGLLLRRDMAGAFFRSVGTKSEAEAAARGRLEPFDFWVLLTLRSCEQYRPKVMTALKHHIVTTGQLTPELLEASLRGHKATLAETCLAQLLELAGVFVRSTSVWYEKRNSEALRDFGVTIYIEAFKEFGNESGAYDYLRQEIIHALTVHCGTLGNVGVGSARDFGSARDDTESEERTTALRVFRSLSMLPLNADGVNALRPYKEFLFALVDHCVHFSLQQTRTLFFVLARVSCRPSDARIADPELYILLRKYLGFPELRLRTAGIVGAVQLICALLPPDQEDADHGDNQVPETENESSSASSEAIALLEMLFRACKRNPGASVCMFDELAGCIERGEMHHAIVEQVSASSSAEFEANFILDAEEGFTCPLTFGQADTVLHALPWMDHDKFQNGLSINVMPRISDALERSDPCERDKLFCICPNFRCMIACDDNGDEFDALFGCGIILPGPGFWELDKVVSSVPAMLTPQLCSAFLHASNWVRELLNAFVEKVVMYEGDDEEHDEAMRSKVSARIGNLLTLEKSLELCVESVAGPWNVPSFGFGGVVRQSVVRGRDGGEVAAELSASDDESSQSDELDDAKPKKRKKGKKKLKARKKKKQRVLPASFRKHLRELRPKVCMALGKRQNGSPAVPKLSSQGKLLLLRTLEGHLGRRLLSVQARKKALGVVRLWCPLVDLSSPSSSSSSWDLSAAEMVGMFSCHGVFDTLRNMYKEAVDDISRDDGDDENDEDDNDGRVTAAIQTVMLTCSCVHHVVASKTLAASAMGKEIAEKAIEAFCPDPEHIGKTVKSMCESADGMAFVEAIGNLRGMGESGHFLAFVMPMMQLAKLLCIESDARQSLSELCDYLLSLDISSAPPKNCIEELLRMRIRCASRPIEALLACAVWVSENDRAPPMLTSKTLPRFYKCVFEELVGQFKANNADLDACLSLVQVFRALVLMTKSESTSKLHATSVRQSKVFMNLFLSNAMPLISNSFVLRRNLTANILTQMQKATRQLQHLCAHAKSTRNQGMMAVVPSLKRTLEAIIFKVKALAAKHGCMNMFRIGNLKNRNIDGTCVEEEQDSSGGDDDSESEDEEDCEDESSGESAGD